MDTAARSLSDREGDRREISSRTRMEDSGGIELERSETDPASSGAEFGKSPILDRESVAGGKKNARRRKAWIFFQDESGFTQQPSVRTTWAPRGVTPVLRSRGNHWDKTSVAAALGFQWDGNKARLFARTKPGSYNTASLIDFLRQLKRFVGGQPVILIWDGLPAHRSYEMSAFLRSQHDWIQVERLPAYAPDLNPTEGVWNNIKSREMANLCPELMQEATSAFRRGLQRLSHTRRLPFSFLRHAGLLF